VQKVRADPTFSSREPISLFRRPGVAVNSRKNLAGQVELRTSWKREQIYRDFGLKKPTARFVWMLMGGLPGRYFHSQSRLIQTMVVRVFWVNRIGTRTKAFPRDSSVV